MLAKDTENGQSPGEQRAEDDELAALGFEKIEKIARFHGWLEFGGWEPADGSWGGELVGPAMAGDGERRLINTIN